MRSRLLQIVLLLLLFQPQSGWGVTSPVRNQPQGHAQTVPLQEGEQLTRRNGKSALQNGFVKRLFRTASPSKNSSKVGRTQPKPKRPRKPNSGATLAILSVIFGALGILTFNVVLFSLLAVIFGAVAKRRYLQGYHDRFRAAKAGFILGIIGISLAVILLVLFIGAGGFF